MEDYQERVVEENKELDGKIQKLEAFLEGGTLIESGERERMTRQKEAMINYSNILAERIAKF